MFYSPTTAELEAEFDGVRAMMLVPSKPVHASALYTIRCGVAALDLPKQAQIWMHVHVNTGRPSDHLFSQIDLMDKDSQPDEILQPLLLNQSAITLTTMGLIRSAAEQVRAVFLSSPVLQSKKAQFS